MRNATWCASLLIVVLTYALTAQAPNLIAPTPPMGWNSWDSYGLTISQGEFLANADYMTANLRQHGWRYAVVDEGWFLRNPEAKPPQKLEYTMDGYGRFTPAVSRFPGAGGDVGFQKLAREIHNRHLLFGIHIVRGIPREAVVKNLPIAGSQFRAADAANKSDTCSWNSDSYGIAANAAGQAYYDSIASLYATWGVDLVKIDCISAPYKGDEIRMFSEALHKTTRPIVLSLSPGPTPIDEIANLRKYAQMWRISNDVWDHWGQWPQAAWSQGVLGQFTLAAEWATLAEPGHWPDADMLPFGFLGPRPGQGKTRTGALTANEERTMMTLWCMMRSPLMIGTNLTRMDATTHALLTNDEVITADQHSTGGRQMSNEGQKIVWASHGEKPGIAYVALFNTGDVQQDIEYPLQSLGLATTSFAIRDVWQHKDIGTADRVKATLHSHASALFRLTASK